MLKPKIGDLVRLKPMKVVKLEPDHFVAHGSESYGYDEIEEILPRPLAVGDRVLFYDNLANGGDTVILAIDGDRAWVKWPEGKRTSRPLAALRRIDPGA